MGLGRVELPTSPLSAVRSNQLSYRPDQIFRLFYSVLVPLPETIQHKKDRAFLSTSLATRQIVRTLSLRLLFL